MKITKNRTFKRIGYAKVNCYEIGLFRKLGNCTVSIYDFNIIKECYNNVIKKFFTQRNKLNIKKCSNI